MEIQDKLETLAAAARFDICSYNGVHEVNRAPSRFIFKAAMPGGGSITLFKVLLTNACTNDCTYCVNQVGRDIRRTSFIPEELARLFMQLHSGSWCGGCFSVPGSLEMPPLPWSR